MSLNATYCFTGDVPGDGISNIAWLTREGAFAKHTVALADQLPIPQAEECAEEIPVHRILKVLRPESCMVTEDSNNSATACHVRIKAKLPSAARVNGSRKNCWARAAFERSLAGLAWPVNIGCNSRSVGGAAVPDGFPDSICAVVEDTPSYAAWRIAELYQVADQTLRCSKYGLQWSPVQA